MSAVERVGVSVPSIRRFYKDATASAEAVGYGLRLDGRPAKTPGKHPLAAPSQAIAELIAAEWRGQGETIAFAAMPATRLAHTAIDGVALNRDATIDSVVRYAASDLLCYLADDPASLVARQRQTWAPLIAWAADAHRLTFVTTSGVVHRAQDADTLARLRALLETFDDFTLAGIAFGAALFGSAILSLALADDRVDAVQAIAAARLDDIFQEERWGVDAETLGRTRALEADAAMLERWFAALKPPA